jgi:hypothetical protein
MAKTSSMVRFLLWFTYSLHSINPMLIIISYNRRNGGDTMYYEEDQEPYEAEVKEESE